MNAFDSSVFASLTAGADAPGWLTLLAQALASYAVPLIALGLAVGWVRGWKQRGLLNAVAAGLLGLGVVQVVGLFAYRPRPFEVGQGLNLLHHLSENSFPSDHATLSFAIAVSLWLAGARRVGAGLALVAVAVGWARVFLGVHWPSDILGGAVLGGLAAVLVSALPSNRLWSAVQSLYEIAICRLHLPEWIFPRGKAD